MDLTRYVLPVIAGAITGMILIAIGEFGIYYLYPLPPGTRVNDADSLAVAMKLMSPNAFVLLLVNYFIASFCAGLVATLVAKRTTLRPALVVGLVLTLAGLYNVIYMPHPLWFSIVNLLIYIPAAYLGYRSVRKHLKGVVI
jgi:hypothetical protein